jgi:hypothetical protein
VTLSIVLAFCPLPLWIAALICGMRGHHTTGVGLAAAGWWVAFVVDVTEGWGLWSTVDGVIAAYCTWRWWRNGGGKDLKKAARELGDESRQRIQALVGALQPAPAGA